MNRIIMLIKGLFLPQFPTRELAIAGLRSVVARHYTVGIREIVARFPDLLDYTDDKGGSPLHWAAEAQSLSSVACLVELGADTQKKDNRGFTPEQAAYLAGEVRMGAYTDLRLKICERLRQGKVRP